MSMEPNRPDDEKRRLPIARPVIPETEDEDYQSQRRGPTREEARYPVPVPQFEPTPPEDEFDFSLGACLSRLLLVGFVLTLIALALLLPPISLSERLRSDSDDADSGG